MLHYLSHKPKAISKFGKLVGVNQNILEKLAVEDVIIKQHQSHGLKK